MKISIQVRNVKVKKEKKHGLPHTAGRLGYTGDLTAFLNVLQKTYKIS